MTTHYIHQASIINTVLKHNILSMAWHGMRQTYFIIIYNHVSAIKGVVCYMLYIEHTLVHIHDYSICCYVNNILLAPYGVAYTIYMIDSLVYYAHGGHCVDNTSIYKCTTYSDLLFAVYNYCYVYA